METWLYAGIGLALGIGLVTLRFAFQAKRQIRNTKEIQVLVEGFGTKELIFGEQEHYLLLRVQKPGASTHYNRIASPVYTVPVRREFLSLVERAKMYDAAFVRASGGWQLVEISESEPEAEERKHELVFEA